MRLLAGVPTRTLILLLWGGVVLLKGDSDASHMAPCFTRIQIPEYPPLARQARIWATLQTSVKLDHEGHVSSVSIQSYSTQSQVRTLLYPAAEKSVRASIFSPTCAGQTVNLIYHFILDQGEPSNTPKDTLWFAYPNEFFVTTAPQYYQPTRSR